MPKYKAPVEVSQAVTGESVASSVVGLTKFHTVRIRQDAIPSENRGAITVKCHMPEEISLDTTAQYNTPFADLIQANPMQSALLSAAGYFPLTQAMTTQFWSGSAPIQLTLPLTIIAWASSDEITRNVLLLKSLQVPRTNKKTKTLIPPGPRIEPSDKFWEGAGKLLETSFGAVTDVLNFAANQAENVLEVGANAVADVQEGKSGAVKAAKKAATEAGKDVIDGAKGTLDSLAKRIGDVHTTIEGMFNVTGKISIKIGEFLYFDDVIIEHVSDAYNIVLGPDGRPQKCQVTIQATTRVTPSYEDLVGTTGIYQYPDPLKNVGTAKTKDSTTDPHKANGQNVHKGSSQKTKQKGRSPSVKSATSKTRKVSRPATVKKG